MSTHSMFQPTEDLDSDMTLELPVGDPRLVLLAERARAETAIDHTQTMPAPDFNGMVGDETAELRVLPDGLAWSAAGAAPSVPSPSSTADLPPSSAQAIAGLERNLRDLADRLLSKSQRVAILESELAQVREDLGGQLDVAQARLFTVQQQEGQRVAAAESRAAALEQELSALRHASREHQTVLDARITELQHAQQVALLQQALQVREITQLRQAAERQLDALRRSEGVALLSRTVHDEQASRIVAQQAEIAEARALQARELAALEARHAADRVGFAEDRAELDRQLQDGSRALAELARERTELLSEVVQLRSTVIDRDERIARYVAQSSAEAAALAGLQANLERLAGGEPLPPVSPLLAPLATRVASATAGTSADLQRMLVWEEEGAARHIVLKPRTTLGRTNDNDIVLDATFASRHHAVVLVDGADVRIEDLNSTNGIRVNGQRVAQQLLEEGDIITIGKTVFRYLLRPAE
jgi:hypothetical protein